MREVQGRNLLSSKQAGAQLHSSSLLCTPGKFTTIYWEETFDKFLLSVCGMFPSTPSAANVCSLFYMCFYLCYDHAPFVFGFSYVFTPLLSLVHYSNVFTCSVFHVEYFQCSLHFVSWYTSCFPQFWLWIALCCSDPHYGHWLWCLGPIITVMLSLRTCFLPSL